MIPFSAHFYLFLLGYTFYARFMFLLLWFCYCLLFFTSEVLLLVKFLCICWVLTININVLKQWLVNENWVMLAGFKIHHGFPSLQIYLGFPFYFLPKTPLVFSVTVRQKWFKKETGIKFLRNCWGSLLPLLESQPVWSEQIPNLMSRSWLSELLTAVTITPYFENSL